MLVPCVVKEAVSKFDAGRDGEREREKKESSARRDDYSTREEGTEGGMRERRIIHGHRSIDFLPFFFFFLQPERASVLNGSTALVQFGNGGCNFPFYLETFLIIFEE